MEVLRGLSHRDQLSEAINFSLLGQAEVEALGRVVRSLPEEEQGSRFWITISHQVPPPALPTDARNSSNCPAALR